MNQQANNKSHSTDSSSTETSDVGVQPAGKPKFKTAGQQIHKWSTYLGIDWIYNAVTGIGFVYWIKYNSTGQKAWSPIDKGVTKALTPLIENESKLQKSIEFGNTFIGIIIGGMLTIPPIMLLESKKVRKKITQFYDRIIYGKDKVENDPEFQAAYARMDNEPEKDFWTGMGARFLALAPLLASVLLPKTAPLMQDYYFDPISKGTDKALRGVGINPVKVIQKVSPNVSAEEADQRWNGYLNKSALPMELGFDIPYALMHKFWYHKLAKWKGIEGSDEAEVTAPSPQPVQLPDNNNSPPDSETPSNHVLQEMDRRSKSPTTDLASMAI